MLKRNNISSIFVLDQDEALSFYTEVLGLEVGDRHGLRPDAVAHRAGPR